MLTVLLVLGIVICVVCAAHIIANVETIHGFFIGIIITILIMFLCLVGLTNI